jgi:hypothetical protein
MRQHSDGSWMGFMGFLGWTRGKQTCHSTDPHSFSRPLDDLSSELCVESWDHKSFKRQSIRTALTLCIRILHTLDSLDRPFIPSNNPEIRAQLPLSKPQLVSIQPQNLPPTQYGQVCPLDLLHPPRPLTHSQISYSIHILRQYMDDVLSALYNQHFLFRLRIPSPKLEYQFRE